MKLSQYLYLLLIVALYLVNYFYLEINVFTFTGIVLALLLILIIIVNFYVKYQNKKKGIKNDDFIFSEKVASSMKTMDIGIQHEASIVSIAFLMVGMIFFGIYVIFFTQYDTVLKGFIVFNSCCGLVLMGSMLVTHYQQFIAYKESTRMMDEFTDQLGGEILSDDKLMSQSPFGDKLVPVYGDNELIDTIMNNNREDKLNNEHFNNNVRRLD